MQPAMEQQKELAIVNAGGTNIVEIKVIQARGVKTCMSEVTDDPARECVVMVEALSRATDLCVYICRSQVKSKLGNRSLG